MKNIKRNINFIRLISTFKILPIMKIKKRDVKAFILGAATILVIDLILNWSEITTAFMKGLNGATYNWIFFL